MSALSLAIVTHNVTRNDGQGRVNYEIARHALAQGAGVTLLADRVDAELLEAGARWERVQPRARWTNLVKVRECARLANRALGGPRRFDVVHGNGFTLTRPHALSTAHFVHDAWGRSPAHVARGRRDVYGAYQWLYTRLNARWERAAYAQARRVVAISGRVRAELLALGLPADRVGVIYNGVDCDEFRPGPARRAELGLPEGVPLALFAGDIRTRRKNLDTVLRALVQIPNLRMGVVGATEGSPFPALAQELGVAERVTFLGFRRDVPDLMRACDLFVCPSRYEPFSLVLLEALASGLPVVTARTVGAAELLSGESGAVVDDPEDASALARELAALAADPARRREMGEAARAIAERHTWRHMAEAYHALYLEAREEGPSA